MATKRYFLSPSVHWRVVNEHCIILDVEKDRYHQVSAEQFESLLPFVDLADSGSTHSRSGAVPAELSEFADELLAANLLTPIPSQATQRATPSLAKPTAIISTPAHSRPLREALHLLPRFLLACAAADYYLRRASLSRTVAVVSSRKEKRRHKIPVDFLDRGIELTHVYHSLRPFYPRNYLCMFDSLALLEFLAHWNILPNWVFGVTVDPFRAHCWVQEGAIVLSDTVSFSSRWFSPIMVL